MSNQQARHDDNRTTALIGHSSINDPSETRRVLVTDGNLHTSVKDSALPTGASTSANQTNGNQQTKIKETVPTDSTKNNSSIVLAYDVDGNLSTITKTIGATSYLKTLTYTAGVLTGVSVWSEV